MLANRVGREAELVAKDFDILCHEYVKDIDEVLKRSGIVACKKGLGLVRAARRQRDRNDGKVGHALPKPGKRR